MKNKQTAAPSTIFTMTEAGSAPNVRPGRRLAPNMRVLQGDTTEGAGAYEASSGLDYTVRPLATKEPGSFDRLSLIPSRLKTRLRRIPTRGHPMPAGGQTAAIMKISRRCVPLQRYA